MKRALVSAAVLVVLAVLPQCFLAGDRGPARDALNFAEMTCALAQPAARSMSEIQSACGIVDALLPVLRTLIGAKLAARRAGYLGATCTDDEGFPRDAGRE